MQILEASALSAPARGAKWLHMLEYLAAAMLAAICVSIFLGVFARYFLHIGLGWTEETARFLQIWMTFLGASIAVKRWGHFQLMLLEARLPPRLRRCTRLFATAMVVLLSGGLLVQGIRLVGVTWNQSSPMLGVPIGAVYLVVPASGVLMLVFGLGHLVAAWREVPASLATHPDAE